MDLLVLVVLVVLVVVVVVAGGAGGAGGACVAVFEYLFINLMRILFIIRNTLFKNKLFTLKIKVLRTVLSSICRAGGAGGAGGGRRCWRCWLGWWYWPCRYWPGFRREEWC